MRTLIGFDGQIHICVLVALMLLLTNASADHLQTEIIVRVRNGVERTVLDDGRLSFSYTSECDLPELQEEAGELLIALTMELWDVISVESGLLFEPLNMSLVQETGLDDLYVLLVPEGTDIDTLKSVMEVCGSTHIEEVYYSQIVEPFNLIPNDPLFINQWSLHNIGQEVDPLWNLPIVCTESEPPGNIDADIDAPEAWLIETGTPSIVIAVLDSGVDVDHPDLLSNLLTGYNFVDDAPTDDWSETDWSHGTTNIGIIGAVGDNQDGIAGVCWNCGIVPLRMLTQASASELIAANAVAYAVDLDVDVINMSWGLPGWGKILSKPISVAYDAGVILVAASGNGGGPVEGYPASDPLVITVGATDPFDSLTCFSSYGPELSVTAPGYLIVSANSDDIRDSATCNGELYCSLHGTSMAAPHVAGLAALVLSANPTLTNIEVRSLIESTADDLGSQGFDDQFGHGRINAYVTICQARYLFCPGDTDTNGVIEISDVLNVISSWGSGAGIGDIDCDYFVGVNDLLEILNSWGPCLGATEPEPLSLSQEIVNAGLIWPDDWYTFEGILTSGSEEEQDNARCWMEHYLLYCDPLVCTCPSKCMGEDPFE